MNLYEYRVPEEVFRRHSSDLVTDLSTPDVEGIYETQVPLEFRCERSDIYIVLWYINNKVIANWTVSNHKSVVYEA